MIEKLLCRGHSSRYAKSSRAAALSALLLACCSDTVWSASQAAPEAQPRLQPKTRAPVTIQWSAEQLALLQSLRTIPDDTQTKPIVRRFEEEVRRTDLTLRQTRAVLHDPKGNATVLDGLAKRLGQHRVAIDRLQRELTQVEVQRETVRNDRQLVSTQFENANQKATQYINMLSSILKTMNEMSMGVIRNLQ